MAYTLTGVIEKVNKKDKGEGDAGTLYRAKASTDALDRDGDVMLAEGCITENFMKNPVMLFIHNYRQVPVAKVLNIGIEPGSVSFEFTFAETEVAKELKYLYDDEFMNAFSVGFYPKGCIRIDDQTPSTLEVDANGTKVKVDLDKYSERPRQIIPTWELLEISPVPVPSNPEALLVRAKDQMIRKFVGSEPQRKMASALLDEQLQDVTGIMKTFLSSIGTFELRGAVPAHSTPIDMEATWSGPTAKVALAKWASSDGSGSKESINWAKFSKGFGWFDSEKTDAFTAYKLPHHVPKGSDLVAIWRGVTAAMAALLGARGGADVGGDAEAVYKHLAGHYKDADKPAPEFSREYTEAELKAIEEGTWTPEAGDPGTDPEANAASATQDEQAVELTAKKVAEFLADRFAELEDSIGIRLSILEEMVKEAGTPLPEGDGAGGEENGDPGKAPEFEELNSILGTAFAVSN